MEYSSAALWFTSDKPPNGGLLSNFEKLIDQEDRTFRRYAREYVKHDVRGRHEVKLAEEY
jgi:hypothetical protein